MGLECDEFTPVCDRPSSCFSTVSRVLKNSTTEVLAATFEPGPINLGWPSGPITAQSLGTSRARVVTKIRGPRAPIPMATLATVAVAVFTFILGPTGCNCAAGGCISSVSVAADLPLTFDELKQAQLTMRRDATCASVDLSQLGDAPVAGTDVHLGSPSSLFITVGMAADGSLWLETGWTDTNFATGDMFSLTVDDASGQAVISEEETTTTYKIYRPNGDSCPPACQEWTFDHRTH